MMLHILGALLLPLCGWLAGDAIQARAVQHLAALQKCLALLERIRQEVAFRGQTCSSFTQSSAGKAYWNPAPVVYRRPHRRRA